MTDDVNYARFVENLTPQDTGTIHNRMSSFAMIHSLHAILGMLTELGEFADVFKKHLFYGKPLDFANLEEELGDIGWYKQLAQNQLQRLIGAPPYETHYRTLNVNKLTVRYGNVEFNEDDAIARADKEE